MNNKVIDRLKTRLNECKEQSYMNIKVRNIKELGLKYCKK